MPTLAEVLAASRQPQLMSIGPRRSEGAQRLTDRLLAEALTAKPTGPWSAAGGLAKVWALKARQDKLAEEAKAERGKSGDLLAELVFGRSLNPDTPELPPRMDDPNAVTAQPLPPQPLVPDNLLPLANAISRTPESMMDPRVQQLVMAMVGQEQPTDDPFTLSPGQSRFDSEGELIARVSHNSPEQWVPVFNRDGTPSHLENTVTGETKPHHGAQEGFTPEQLRTNQAIDSARAGIEAAGLSLPDILVRIRKGEGIGSITEGFDPILARQVELAAQVKYGDDPEHASFVRGLLPQPEEPPPPLPPSEPEGPGWLARQFNSVFGDSDAVAGESAGSPAAASPAGASINSQPIATMSIEQLREIAKLDKIALRALFTEEQRKALRDRWHALTGEP